MITVIVVWLFVFPVLCVFVLWLFLFCQSPVSRGKKGSGSGELIRPLSICVDSDDLVYVGEHGNDRVSVFTSEGEFLKSFGSKGSKQGQFIGPYGIAVDGGAVCVSDQFNNRVQMF